MATVLERAARRIPGISRFLAKQDSQPTSEITILDRFPELRTITNFPQTVLIIPDGNRRYAAEHGLAAFEGHKQGAMALQQAVEMFVEIPQIKTLQVWGFSHTNWERPKEERDGIMKVIQQTVERNLPVFHQHKIRFVRMGREEQLPNEKYPAIKDEYPELWKTLCDAEEATKDYTNKTLAGLVDFSGDNQTTRMLRRCLKEYPGTNPDDLTDEMAHKLRDGNGFVTPADLIIRTSGEMRTSDIGWLNTNSEFFPVDAFLPNVVQRDLVNALLEFNVRNRTFGAGSLADIKNSAHRLLNLPKSWTVFDLAKLRSNGKSDTP